MARCTAIRYESGEQCKLPAIRGGTVCQKHGGAAPQVKARAAVRDAVATWTEGMAVADPGETLLRLMTVSLLRADQHRVELDRIVAEHGWIRAFVGRDIVTVDGKSRVVGEYARQLAKWEYDERRHAADLAVKAVAAGIAERQVRVLEKQVEVFAEALRAGVAETTLTAEQQAEVMTSVGRRLRIVAG